MTSLTSLSFLKSNIWKCCFPDSNTYKPTYEFPEEKEVPKPKGMLCCLLYVNARCQPVWIQ